MSDESMSMTRKAPKIDHQWRFVIRQLRIRPPVAFAFSIIIAGEYRLIAIPTYKATKPPTTSKTKPPQIAPMAVAGFTVPPAASRKRPPMRPFTSPRTRKTTKKFAKFFVQTSNIPDRIVPAVARRGGGLGKYGEATAGGTAPGGVAVGYGVGGGDAVGVTNNGL